MWVGLGVGGIVCGGDEVVVVVDCCGDYIEYIVVVCDGWGKNVV